MAKQLTASERHRLSKKCLDRVCASGLDYKNLAFVEYTGVQQEVPGDKGRTAIYYWHAENVNDRSYGLEEFWLCANCHNWMILHGVPLVIRGL